MAQLLDPAGYLGSADTLIDRALTRHHDTIGILIDEYRSPIYGGSDA